MKRLGTLLLVVLLAAPLVGRAQPPAASEKRVAALCTTRCEGRAFDALRRGLREHGWIEGKNLRLDVRGAEGQPGRLRGLADELLAARPDVMVAMAPQPVRAARDATSTVPIVMVAVADPVSIGLVPSLTRPGGNLTGVTTLRVAALLVVGDPITFAPAARVPERALQAKLPAIYLARDVAVAGGLIAYGPDFLQIYRRAADYVDRILKGAKPADMPIEQPTTFELVVNLKTARALGVIVPRSLLVRADEAIE